MKFKARHNTSQLVMLHERTHPRLKSCNMVRNNFVHYICNTTYIFRRNMKFKARHVTSRHVTARHTAEIYISMFQVM
jgi:hypothetical protein